MKDLKDFAPWNLDDLWKVLVCEKGTIDRVNKNESINPAMVKTLIDFKKNAFISNSASILSMRGSAVN